MSFSDHGWQSAEGAVLFPVRENLVGIFHLFFLPQYGVLIEKEEHNTAISTHTCRVSNRNLEGYTRQET
jgi:hypothetical protein